MTSLWRWREYLGPPQFWTWPDWMTDWHFIYICILLFRHFNWPFKLTEANLPCGACVVEIGIFLTYSKLTSCLSPNLLAIIFEFEGPTVYCRDHLIGTNFTITSAMVHIFGERSTCSLKLSILLIYYTTFIISTTTFALAFFLPFCAFFILLHFSSFKPAFRFRGVWTHEPGVNWTSEQLAWRPTYQCW